MPDPRRSAREWPNERIPPVSVHTLRARSFQLLQNHDPFMNTRKLHAGLMVLLAALVLSICPDETRAEGYTFKDGHFDFPEVTRLTLTQKQLKLLETRFKPGIKISLTKEQTAQIKADTGVKEPPTKLQIYKVENLDGDCACGLVNFAIIIDGGRIEMPHYQVVSDSEAAYYD